MEKPDMGGKAIGVIGDNPTILQTPENIGGFKRRRNSGGDILPGLIGRFKNFERGVRRAALLCRIGWQEGLDPFVFGLTLESRTSLVSETLVFETAQAG